MVRLSCQSCPNILLSKLSNPNPGQIEVNPGVIIMGYKGDPVFDDPHNTGGRPAWTKGGTMMVFRKLEQDVPAFNNYLTKNGCRWKEFAPPPHCPELTNEEGAELWGARLIGRWKSVRHSSWIRIFELSIPQGCPCSIVSVQR